MARHHSNKQVATKISSLPSSDNNNKQKDCSSLVVATAVEEELDRKITLATEGFTTNKFCELILRDRSRLSKENALIVCDYIIAKRYRCYHTIARDLSARPHEILNLKIKDIMFKTVDNGRYQYAEVLVNGKTGSRHIPLI